MIANRKKVMGVARSCAVGLAWFALVVGGAATANNLRGQIREPSPLASSGWLPLAGATVQLTKNGAGGLVAVDQTESTSDGYYFFFKVEPGDYVLVVRHGPKDNLQFPLRVGQGSEQDIPPVLIKD